MGGGENVYWPSPFVGFGTPVVAIDTNNKNTIEFYMCSERAENNWKTSGKMCINSQRK